MRNIFKFAFFQETMLKKKYDKMYLKGFKTYQLITMLEGKGILIGGVFSINPQKGQQLFSDS